jgi:hypothetical protein
LLIFGEPLPRAVALLSYGTSAARMIESRGCAANTLAPRNNQLLTKCNEKDILLDSAERPSAGF